MIDLWAALRGGAAAEVLGASVETALLASRAWDRLFSLAFPRRGS